MQPYEEDCLATIVVVALVIDCIDEINDYAHHAVFGDGRDAGVDESFTLGVNGGDEIAADVSPEFVANGLR